MDVLSLWDNFLNWNNKVLPADTTIDNESKEVKALRPDTDIKFEIYNFNTGLRQKQWTHKNGQKQFNLNLSGLNKGVYILKATKGKFRQSIKVIVNYCSREIIENKTSNMS